MSSFSDKTRKIIFQSNFSDRASFQNIWKKKIWFFVQCYEFAINPKYDGYI